MDLPTGPLFKDRRTKLVLGDAVGLTARIEDVVDVPIHEEANLDQFGIGAGSHGTIGIDDQGRAAREWAMAKTDDLVRRALTGVAAEFLLYAALPLRDPSS